MGAGVSWPHLGNDMKVDLPTEYFVETRIKTHYVPSCSGKPRGHNIHLSVMRVPGAYLYKRTESYTITRDKGHKVDINDNDTWTVPDIT